jgi:hypothetical protein
MPGFIIGLPCSWGKYRNMPLYVDRVSKIEIIKDGHESCSTQTRERLRWRGPATIEKYRPPPLVREGLANLMNYVSLGT